jgi:hypothetical protein
MKKHNGTVGEQYAERYGFRELGWTMFRTQPPTKRIIQRGKLVIVDCAKGGIADYTGYGLCLLNLTNAIKATFQTNYIACEIKECDSEISMPHSRLSVEQRLWMSKIPSQCAFVGVFWLRFNKLEIFQSSVGEGCYKRGSGIRSV